MTKYGAKKVVEDGFKFDSKIEKDYYLYLKQQKQKGEIKEFTLQPTFELQPKFEKDGKKYRAITYVADFKVIHNDDRIEIIDVKGMELPLFKLKEKMYHYHFEHPLTLITYSKIDGGWISLTDLYNNRKIRKKERENKNKH